MVRLENSRGNHQFEFTAFRVRQGTLGIFKFYKCLYVNYLNG